MVSSQHGDNLLKRGGQRDSERTNEEGERIERTKLSDSTLGLTPSRHRVDLIRCHLPASFQGTISRYTGHAS